MDAAVNAGRLNNPKDCVFIFIFKSIYHTYTERILFISAPLSSVIIISWFYTLSDIIYLLSRHYIMKEGYNI